MGDWQWIADALRVSRHQLVPDFPVDDLARRTRIRETLRAKLSRLQTYSAARAVLFFVSRLQEGIGVKFELFVAARYLRAKRRQAVVGVIPARPGIRVA